MVVGAQMSAMWAALTGLADKLWGADGGAAAPAAATDLTRMAPVPAGRIVLAVPPPTSHSVWNPGPTSMRTDEDSPSGPCGSRTVAFKALSTCTCNSAP